MVQLGMIGTGDWGKNLLRNFAQLAGVRLAVVCDLDPARLEYVRTNYPEVNTTTQAAELFRDNSLEALVIASSAKTHYALARQALLAGKDVLVEKPLALHYTEAEELIKIAEEKQRILMVGHLLRYHQAVEKIKSLIRSGELGEIYYIYTQRLNLGRVRQDENALWSFAPHDFSVVLYLLEEEPLSISAQGAAYLQKGIQDLVFVNLRFRNHKTAHIHLSWLDPHKIRKITVVGSKKMLVFDDMEPTEKVRLYDKGAQKQTSYDSYAEYVSLRFGDVIIPYLKLSEPLRNECQHFVECVRTRQAPLTDGREGLRVVRLLEAAQQSMDQDGILVPMSR